jgi:hypothetical protein
MVFLQTPCREEHFLGEINARSVRTYRRLCPRLRVKHGVTIGIKSIDCRSRVAAARGDGQEVLEL